MNWIPETTKPEPYKTVLLALDLDHYTTGWWAEKANRGRGAWIGLALNQSPSTYKIVEGAVTAWCEIVRP